MKKYYLFLLFLFSISVSNNAQYVAITSPSNGQTFTIPSGQTTTSVQVCWTYQYPGHPNYWFELETEFGTVDQILSCYTVNNVGPGSKDWTLYMYWIDTSYNTHYTSDNVDFSVVYGPQTFKGDNNFTASGGSNHGTMKIDGITRTIPLSGYPITKNVGQNTTLEAISPQTDNQGKQRTWASCEVSDWRRDNVFLTNNQSYAFTVAWDDHNKTYKANLAQVSATTS